jgi:hypothetical protein
VIGRPNPDLSARYVNLDSRFKLTGAVRARRIGIIVCYEFTSPEHRSAGSRSVAPSCSSSTYPRTSTYDGLGRANSEFCCDPLSIHYAVGALLSMEPVGKHRIPVSPSYNPSVMPISATTQRDRGRQSSYCLHTSEMSETDNVALLSKSRIIVLSRNGEPNIVLF